MTSSPSRRRPAAARHLPVPSRARHKPSRAPPLSYLSRTRRAVTPASLVVLFVRGSRRPFFALFFSPCLFLVRLLRLLPFHLSLPRPSFSFYSCPFFSLLRRLSPFLLQHLRIFLLSLHIFLLLPSFLTISLTLPHPSSLPLSASLPHRTAIPLSQSPLCLYRRDITLINATH